MEILQSLYNLTAAISENRFITTRPPAVGERMDDFLLLRISQPMRDRGDTYQSTVGQITAFARNLAGTDALGNALSGLENTPRLEEMQSAMLGLFPVVTDRYHAKSPLLLAAGSDGAGFHCITIQFNITIFKQP